MSFIYDDKKLINQLLKLSQTAQPAAAPAVPDNKAHLDLASKLLQNLKTEINGGSVFTSEREDASIRPVHLQDFSSLLNFLSFNKIKANNYQIVIKNEYPNTELPEVAAYIENLKKTGYVEYPATASEPIQYFISKNGLIGYLRDLQSKNNPVLNSMVSARINDVNAQLNFEMSPDAPAKTEERDQENKDQENKGSKVKPVGYKEEKERAGQGAGDKGKTINFDALIGKLPLQADMVDFARIKAFVEKYSQITGKFSSQMGQVNQKLDYLESNFRKDTSQSLSDQPDQIAANLQSPGMLYAYVTTLYQLVSNVSAVLTDFKSNYWERLSPAMQEELNKQIGTNEQDASSLKGRNIFALQRLVGLAQNFVRTK